MIFPGLARYADSGLLALRVAVGIIFIVHGVPKVMVPLGLAPNPGQMSAGFVAFLAGQGLVEAIGGLAMVAGILVQVVAMAFAIIMLGAIGLKNTAMPTGFTAPNATGWEFDFILLAANLALLVIGPGKLALTAGRTPSRSAQ